MADRLQRRLDGLGTVATVAAQLAKALLLLLLIIAVVESDSAAEGRPTFTIKETHLSLWCTPRLSS